MQSPVLCRRFKTEKSSMNAATLEQLFQSDELEWLKKPDVEVEGGLIERKRNFDTKELARQISAFANAPGPGGLLISGVEKDGTISGIERREFDRDIATLHQLVDDSGWESRLVPISDERVVVFIRAPFVPNRVTRLADGTAWQRRGDKKHQLSHSEIDELRFATGERSFEDQAAALYDLELLDAALCREFQQGLADTNQHTIDNPLELDLDNRTLVRNEKNQRVLTNAGLLVLGKKPHALIPGAVLRFQRFEGIEERVGAERNVIKDQQFEGPIPILLNEFRKFMQGQIREYDFLGADGKFVRAPEYPRPAWDEAVVNALVHRSYSQRQADVTVKMFDDRLEVESPGGFPGGSLPTRSHPRNRHLADALKYFKLVRLAREGTRRIELELQRAGLPAAEYKQGNNQEFVRLTLRNDIANRLRALGKDTSREQEWKEIQEQLNDPLKFVRLTATERWSGLVANGEKPPTAAIAALIQLVTSPRIGHPERESATRLLENIKSFENGVLVPLVEWLLKLEDKNPDQIDERHSMRRAIARSPTSVEYVLRWLETRWGFDTPFTPHEIAVKWAVAILKTRLSERPLPERAWLVRVLAALKQYRTDLTNDLRLAIEG